MNWTYHWTQEMVKEALNDRYREMFKQTFGYDGEINELYEFYRLKNPQRRTT